MDLAPKDTFGQTGGAGVELLPAGETRGLTFLSSGRVCSLNFPQKYGRSAKVILILAPPFFLAY